MCNLALKERLLCEPRLTLEKTITLCLAAESSISHARAMTLTPTSAASTGLSQDIDLIRHQGRHSLKSAGKGPFASKPGSTKSNKHTQNCGNYVRIHQPRQCPVFGKCCRNCNKQNHFADACRQSKRVHALAMSTASIELPSLSDLYIDGMSTLRVGDMPVMKPDVSWFANININGHRVKVKVDWSTGINTPSQNNSIPWKSQSRLLTQRSY